MGGNAEGRGVGLEHNKLGMVTLSTMVISWQLIDDRLCGPTLTNGSDG